MNKYVFYRTPSHGYLEISLKKFPGAEKLVSMYSYIDVKRNTLLAEEDCDMRVIINKYGIKTKDIISIQDYGEFCLKNANRIDYLMKLQLSGTKKGGDADVSKQ